MRDYEYINWLAQDVSISCKDNHANTPVHSCSLARAVAATLKMEVYEGSG